MAETERHQQEEGSIEEKRQVEEAGMGEDVDMEEALLQAPTTEEESEGKGPRLWDPIRDTSLPEEKDFYVKNPIHVPHTNCIGH